MASANTTNSWTGYSRTSAERPLRTFWPDSAAFRSASFSASKWVDSSIVRRR